MNNHKLTYSEGPLTDEQIFDLFACGRYVADLDAGVIFDGRTGKPLSLKPTGRQRRHYSVRLHGEKSERQIAVHKLIWMLANGCSVPPGFEVHHDDEDKSHNAFKNLFALHENDHRKLHGKSVTYSQKAEAPF